MSTLYGNLPAFADGQTLSAAAHLNTLQRYISLAHDDVAGVSTPAYGCKSYVIRHQWNTLEYYLVRNSGTVTIKYNSTTVKTITTGGSQTGTVNLSGWAFTVDAFYYLTVTGDCTVYWLREKQTTSYPVLASFADDTIPTAAQWQDLSDYAALIGDALDVPQPVNTRLYSIPDTTIYQALIHRGRYLKFQARMWAPNYCLDPRFARIRIYADATNIFEASHQNIDFDEDIDLNSAGLTLGDEYLLRMILDQTNSCDADGQFWLYSLYEYPEEGGALAGWEAFQEWTHADWAWGSSAPAPRTARVQLIKSNLEALSAAMSEVVYPSPERTYQFLYGVRRRRFLHYRTYSDQSCTINWSYRGEDQQATLPESSTDFLAADLDSLEGLYPGTPYWIGGTRFAVEDSHA